LKKSNNLIRNRLDKSHDKVEVNCLTGTPAEGSLEELVKQIAEISEDSWKGSAGIGLNLEGSRNFIGKLTTFASNNDWLLVWLLKLDGYPVAMEYQLVYRGLVHALRADFREQYSKLSPGSFLNWRILESLFDRGLQEYQMGPGDNSYKRKWSEAQAELGTYVVFSKSWRGRFLATGKLLIGPFVKRVMGRFTRKEPAQTGL